MTKIFPMLSLEKKSRNIFQKKGIMRKCKPKKMLTYAGKVKHVNVKNAF